MFVFKAASDESRVTLRKRSPQGFLGQVDIYDASENRIKNHYAGADENFSLEFPTQRGSSYLVAVRTYGSTGGDYELVVRGK